MRSPLLSSLGFLFVATLTSQSLRAQSSPPPEVYSANNSADYSTTIAQGSLFTVFGYYLGPAVLAEVSAFPLPNVLSGTSVTVTSGSTTLNYRMIYTSIGQVAAILPSNTPAEVIAHRNVRGNMVRLNQPGLPRVTFSDEMGR